MKIQNMKIIEATERELYDLWLIEYSEIMDYHAYEAKMRELGVEIRSD